VRLHDREGDRLLAPERLAADLALASEADREVERGAREAGVAAREADAGVVEDPERELEAGAFLAEHLGGLDAAEREVPRLVAAEAGPLGASHLLDRRE